MSTDAVILLLCTLFLGSIVSTVAGGGLSAITLMFMTLFFEVHTSVAFMSLLMFTTQISKTIHFHAFARKDIVFRYALLGLPCSFIGGWFLFIMPERAIEIAIALICLLFVGFKIFNVIPHIPYHKGLIVFVGGINGFIGGMIGFASLIRKPFLLSMGLSKEVFIGTSAMISIILNMGRSVAYIYNIEWNNTFTIILITAFPIVFVAVSIGKYLLHFISKSLYEYLVLCIIALGALRLLFFT